MNIHEEFKKKNSDCLQNSLSTEIIFAYCYLPIHRFSTHFYLIYALSLYLCEKETGYCPYKWSREEQNVLCIIKNGT